MVRVTKNVTINTKYMLWYSDSAREYISNATISEAKAYAMWGMDKFNSATCRIEKYNYKTQTFSPLGIVKDLNRRDAVPTATYLDFKTLTETRINFTGHKAKE